MRSNFSGLSVLHKRILTGAALVAFVVLGITLSTPLYFAWVSGLIVLLAVNEWAKLTRLSFKHQIIFFSVMGVLLLIQPWLSSCLTRFVLAIGCLFWLGAFYPVLRYKGIKPNWAMNPVIFILMGILVLYPFWIGIMTIYHLPYGKLLLLLLLLIIAAEDTGAYFTGKKWGRHKLMPYVSPGKTWEGVAGGMSCALLVAVGMVIFLPHIVPPAFMMVALAVLIIAILGDLFESLIKRIQGVKDSGTLLPGHGGILDRIDSLTAALPFFALGLSYF